MPAKWPEFDSRSTRISWIRRLLPKNSELAFSVQWAYEQQKALLSNCKLLETYLIHGKEKLVGFKAFSALKIHEYRLRTRERERKREYCYKTHYTQAVRIIESFDGSIRLFPVGHGINRTLWRAFQLETSRVWRRVAGNLPAVKSPREESLFSRSLSSRESLPHILTCTGITSDRTLKVSD